MGMLKNSAEDDICVLFFFFFQFNYTKEENITRKNITTKLSLFGKAHPSSPASSSVPGQQAIKQNQIAQSH